MSNLREEFEKLPEIAIVLEHCRYSETKNMYVSHYFNTMLINGAWYAFQEQQKKIDQIGRLINYAELGYDLHSAEEVLNEIKELLK